MRYKLLLVILFGVFYSYDCYTQIEIPNFFGSNMVLPRDKNIPIKGTAQPNEEIVVTIKNQSHTITADGEGNFSVVIDPLSYGGPFSLTFKGNTDLVLENILVGDLWLCGGQSNMQYSLKMIDYHEKDSLRTVFPNMRLGSVGLNSDYLPRKDLSLMIWQEATIENAQNFSATGFFFGRHLTENQDIPIGLIDNNLGATAIETWMSIDALKEFSQFDAVTKDILTTNKDFETINKNLVEYRKTWDKKYYLKGRGMTEKWYLDNYNDSSWDTIEAPFLWEYSGIENHDGSFWLRKTFDLDSLQLKENFELKLGQIDDYDITWVNGHKVGESFGNNNYRNYSVPKEILREKNNTITIRIFDIGDFGGMYTAAFWGKTSAIGTWKYKIGRKINLKKFPTPKIVNGSIFTYPSLLYNGNIAPLHDIPITGVIWYQGESNENRTVEYELLLKAMINDWRNKWNQEDLPFLIVQLANFRSEDVFPNDSKWAEVRESQMNATQLHNVDIITAIDIGNANDIHPHNKMEVGRRLGLLAMHYSYEADLKKGPSFDSYTIEGSNVVVTMNMYGSKLRSLDKHGYLRGFSIAGENGKFEWAKAHIISENKILVYSDNIEKPKYVRYAWSDNPGDLDLVNEDLLPAFPFRTDNFELKWAKELYWLNPHNY